MALARMDKLVKKLMSNPEHMFNFDLPALEPNRPWEMYWHKIES